MKIKIVGGIRDGDEMEIPDDVWFITLTERDDPNYRQSYGVFLGIATPAGEPYFAKG